MTVQSSFPWDCPHLASTFRLLFPTHSPTRPINPTRFRTLNMDIILDHNTGYDNGTDVHHQSNAHRIGYNCINRRKRHRDIGHGVKQHRHPLQTVDMMNWQRKEREWTRKAEREHILSVQKRYGIYTFHEPPYRVHCNWNKLISLCFQWEWPQPT